jgi:hypothetical protein
MLLIYISIVVLFIMVAITMLMQAKFAKEVATFIKSMQK